MKPFTKKSLGLLSFSVALLASGQAFAADADGTCTSITGGGPWSTVGTWATGGANTGCDDGTTRYEPSANDDVVIPSTTAVTGTAAMVAKSVTISAGGKFTVGNNIGLTILGDLINNATNAADVNLDANSLIFFNAAATVGGSTVTTFGNLIVNNAVTLNTTPIIAGALSMGASGSIAAGIVKFSDANHNISIGADTTIPALDLSSITTSKTITFTGAFNSTITALTLPSPATIGGKVVVFIIPNAQTLTFTGGIPTTCAATTYTVATNVVTGVTGGNLTCTIQPQTAIPASVDLRESGKVNTISEEITIK